MRPSPAQQAAGFALQALVVLAGEMLNAFAFRALIVPNGLLSGGVVGSALLINRVFGLPIGLQTVLYNIPIFWLGWRFLGRRFVALSVLGVVSFSVLVDNLHVPLLTQDLLLVAVFGGLLTGIADGLIIRFGGSTGGFDILGLIVSRRFGLAIGQVFLAFNAIIIALSAFTVPNFTLGVELAMYTLISLYVGTQLIDRIVEATPRPVAIIVSTKDHEIAGAILTTLGRGVTYLEGTGAYTSQRRRVLMCVLTRYELVVLRRLVAQLDPHAFIVVLNAADVIGRFDRPSLLGRRLP
jgi:uncharacterized membrane-anchored protein YitT (DUF2179 family)